MKELTIAAKVENIPAVTDFVNEQLEAVECPAKTLAQICIVIDELMSNIANYAYAPGSGELSLRVDTKDNPRRVQLDFIDSGLAYDPLSNRDPDTGLPAEEREIGGLGIFMVKKMVDEIRYSRENGQNILTVTKIL